MYLKQRPGEPLLEYFDRCRKYFNSDNGKHDHAKADFIAEAQKFGDDIPSFDDCRKALTTDGKNDYMDHAKADFIAEAQKFGDDIPSFDEYMGRHRVATIARQAAAVHVMREALELMSGEYDTRYANNDSYPPEETALRESLTDLQSRHDRMCNELVRNLVETGNVRYCTVAAPDYIADVFRDLERENVDR